MADVLEDVLRHKDKIDQAIPVIKELVKAIKFIVGLFKRKPQPLPLPSPAAGGAPPAITAMPDDDKITPQTPRTSAGIKVGSVRARIIKVQLSRQRFPEEYTDQNQFGLMDNLGEINSGAAAVPYDSKVWLDLTPFDEAGMQIRYDEAIKPPFGEGLAYRTAHYAEGVDGDLKGARSFIEGVGGSEKSPNKPWGGGDSGPIGQGHAAWEYTNGFTWQIQVFGEGTLKLYGEVAGVRSNELLVRFS